MQKNCFSYPVEIVEDAFGESAVLAETLRKATEAEDFRVLIVADVNLVQHAEGLGTKIGRYVQAHGIRLAGSPVILPGGEKSKADSLESAIRILSSLVSARLGRNDIVLALGGGSILDVAGYAASQVRGGVRIVRVPTTPAAMMDAAFADFAAVDSSSVKDALRVPSVPSAVVIDPTFAGTVLDGVWRGGVGEAVRLAVARDAALLKKIAKLSPSYRDRNPEALVELVESVISVRRKRPPTDVALWSSSRLEVMSGFKLPHGYSVPIGLCVELCYAVGRGCLKADALESVVGVMETCGALDGLVHSGHLLRKAEDLISGLDDWALCSGRGQVEVLSAVGKSVGEEPDREAYLRAFAETVTLPKRG